MMEKMLKPVIISAFLALSLSACEEGNTGPDTGEHQHNHQNDLQINPLSPVDSLNSMVVQDGYTMELVAAEPMIEEPVTFAFDGNGRIYVAEMLTYMQDADSTGTFRSVSRIKRLEDKDGDGIFESFTVFADNLLLPRMISTLEDGRILVRETNTLDLLLITDTDGDGVSDTRETIYEGGPRGGNLEHQPSGLIYTLDNWLYVTYTNIRYKFKDDKIIAQPIQTARGQWGLAHDKAGRIYFSTAGGENPVYGFQAPIVYSPIKVDGEQAPGFREVFPLDRTPDVQGGIKRLRDDNTLNRFTGGGGQSIYVGGLYDDMAGDYIIPEPVGNLIRRSKVDRSDGHTVISNPYQNDRKEFVASTDASFRPVWTDTAPDGSLMILDMYRGIIQEGNWTKKGSYLRGVIDKYGFDKIIGRGRLYRIKKEGVELYKQPLMFSETPIELVKHLKHKNRWWRLEAQKLMVLSGDKSLIPVLKKIALNSDNADERVHALWTLEGLGIVDKPLLVELFNAKNRAVRNAAIRISEQLVVAGDKDIPSLWLALASDDDVEVSQQVILSSSYTESDNADLIHETALKMYPSKKGVLAIGESRARLARAVERRKLLASGNKEFAAAMIAGESAYKGLCASCHGEDGKGTLSDGELIAPSLHQNARVSGNTTLLLNLVLHGMEGDIDGISYTGGMMPSIASNDNDFVASVLTYIRSEFDNNASMVEPADVALVREKFPEPEEMWTQTALEKHFNQKLDNKEFWKISTNFNVNKRRGINRLTDEIYYTDKNKSFFASERDKKNGDAITIELPKLTSIMEITIGMVTSRESSKRYLVEFSTDGKNWQLVGGNKTEKNYEKAQTFGFNAKYIRITNQEDSYKWAISEIDLIGREVD